jgi:lipoprotein-anchoring transpeptidase ErfK/SrfK
VRPRVRLGGSSATGFGNVTVKGTVAPARLGRKITVVVTRGSRVIARRSITLEHGKRFAISVPARGSGRYLVRVRYTGDDRFGAAGTAKLLRAVLPSLSVGSSGPAVAALRQQLLDLGYRQSTSAASYGYDLVDAVIAFQKVQGLSRTGTVGPEVWQALATAQRPKPRYPSQGDHLEVDKGHQVLLLVRDGQTQWVLPVSTGGYGRYTPEGTFSIIRKVSGFDPSPLGVLWDPMYFVGGYAIHGNPSVPAYPASHGCVRVPMWAATWLYGFNDIGEVVDVYS